jgi:hypothetical protein
MSSGKTREGGGGGLEKTAAPRSKLYDGGRYGANVAGFFRGRARAAKAKVQRRKNLTPLRVMGTNMPVLLNVSGHTVALLRQDARLLRYMPRVELRHADK